MAKVMVLGADGYIGSQYIHYSDHECIAVDNYYKRTLLSDLGIEPLYPVPMLHELHDGESCYHDVTKAYIQTAIEMHKPDVIIHLAENPSAPYSMSSRSAGEEVINNNLSSTLNLIYAIRDTNPNIHLIKLGTMGQYGTPNVSIPEGWFDVTRNGRTDRLLFPRTPHSIYHLSKAFDSDALAFASRMWGLRVTDLQQGFVHSTITDTARFCYDAEFGTVLNRFMIQAIVDHPLTVYGEGGQTRGVLHIRDTLQCLDLAIENTPDKGEYRVINQLTEWKSINDFALLVKTAASRMGIKATINHITNPRIEKESHFYQVEHQTLKDYGLRPHLIDLDMIQEQMERLMQYKGNINVDYILPKVRWA